METFKAIVQIEIAKYADDNFTSISEVLVNADRTTYIVLTIAQVGRGQVVSPDLIVRLLGDYIIIDHDLNRKPLVKALLLAGIPRDHIILVYEGEPIPETSRP